MFQILTRNNSRSNQNHFVKSFDPFFKHFRFSGNEKEVNHNHLKHLFYRFTVTVQKLEAFQTYSHLKHFDFSLFQTGTSDSSLNQKRRAIVLASTINSVLLNLSNQPRSI
jgi:hypothetical protein